MVEWNDWVDELIEKELARGAAQGSVKRPRGSRAPVSGSSQREDAEYQETLKRKPKSGAPSAPAAVVGAGEGAVGTAGKRKRKEGKKQSARVSEEGRAGAGAGADGSTDSDEEDGLHADGDESKVVDIEEGSDSDDSIEIQESTSEVLGDGHALETLDEATRFYRHHLASITPEDKKRIAVCMLWARHQCASVFGYLSPNPSSLRHVGLRVVFTGKLLFLAPSWLQHFNPCVWVPKKSDPPCPVPACLRMLCNYAPSTFCTKLLKSLDESLGTKECMHNDVPQIPRLPHQESTAGAVLRLGEQITSVLTLCAPMP